MKKSVIGVALGSCVLILMIAASSYAQLPGQTIQVAIPFDFSVRNTLLPAGNYEIRRISDEPSGLKIQSVSHANEHALFETEPVEARQIQSRGELVFHRYGDRYFLYEVWAPGLETGRELTPSREERLIKREMAKNDQAATPEMVSVAIY